MGVYSPFERMFHVRRRSCLLFLLCVCLLLSCLCLVDDVLMCSLCCFLQYNIMLYDTKPKGVLLLSSCLCLVGVLKCLLCCLL